MSVVSTIKMTARQFLQLGEDPPGVRLELIDGEIAVSPSPIPEHSHVDTELRGLLRNHIKSNDLGLLFGDVDTIFGEHDVRRPDLLYFSKKRLHLIGEKAMEGPPDLCVEIISPSSTVTDRVDKFEQYQAGGVLHYWVVDPQKRTLEGYSLKQAKYIATEKGHGSEIISLPPFKDLKISLGELWLNLPPRGRSRK